MDKSNNVRLPITLLRKVTHEILDDIENNLVTEINIHHDMYWHLRSLAKYSMKTVPEQEELQVGSLFDDVEFLSNGTNSAASLSHLIPIFEYLHYHLSEELKYKYK